MKTTNTNDNRRKCADVVRETDGSTQCVPYPGWRLIVDRLATRPRRRSKEARRLWL
jgi:hypothetical protein